MPQTPCFTEIFVSNGNNALVSSQAILIGSKGVGSYILSDSGRPFIPFCGAVLNANGVYVPDTAANNQTFAATFTQIFKDARQASINYVTDAVGFPSGNVTPLSSYLYKKTFSVAADNQMFLQNSGIVFDFWLNANPAWTNAEYSAALSRLKQDIQQFASKDLYIPNNFYSLSAALDALILAWKTANPLMVAFLGVELYQ